MDKVPQNLTVRFQSMKTINPMNTRLEISATSENNSETVGGEQVESSGLCPISDLWRQNKPINESKTDQIFLRIHISLGLFSWLVVSFSCLFT